MPSFLLSEYYLSMRDYLDSENLSYTNLVK